MTAGGAPRPTRHPLTPGGSPPVAPSSLPAPPPPDPGGSYLLPLTIRLDGRPIYEAVAHVARQRADGR